MSIFKKIGNLFKKAETEVHKFVLEISDFALAHCKDAVNVLQAIKTGIDSNTFKTLKDLVVTLIPGTTDDVIVNAVVAVLDEDLPKACTALGIVYDAASKGTDVEKLAAIMQGISNTTTDKKAKIYTELAAKIATQLSDGKLSWNEIIVDTQYIYSNKDSFGIK